MKIECLLWGTFFWDSHNKSSALNEINAFYSLLLPSIICVVVGCQISPEIILPELQCGPEGPGSRLAWRNTAIYANGTMQNPSWVQCLPSSHSDYTSEGTRVGKPSFPWRIKIVTACLRIILRDEFETIGNSLLRSSSPMLTPPPSLNSSAPDCVFFNKHCLWGGRWRWGKKYKFDTKLSKSFSTMFKYLGKELLPMNMSMLTLDVRRELQNYLKCSYDYLE